MTAWRSALLARPLAGEAECGDAGACLTWADAQGPGCLLAMVDGLGHGPEAAAAAAAAMRVLAAAPHAELAAQMAALDVALRPTRGAAVGLAQWRPGGLHYLAVGNTRALRWRDGQATRLSSSYGIVGGGLPARLVPQALAVAEGDWLLMFSDGLDEMLNLAGMLPEWQREPLQLCEHLMARWRQPRDDAAVLAAVLVAP